MTETDRRSGNGRSARGGCVFPRREIEGRIPRGVDNPFAVAIERGELYVELYRPEGEDLQAPHERDECYFVVEGNGTFVLGDERVPFEPGDCIFVPAGVVHRFEDFGEHVLTWVLFYGPPGGDRA
jgi:mannose-6-phosphate isomerase-like protein (cupin superfamily)